MTGTVKTGIFEAYTLFSSSKGNCAYLRCGDDELLIDVGVSARAIETSLRSLGTSLDNISAIIITHEHSDHIKGLDIIEKHKKIPVYAPFRSAVYISERSENCRGMLRDVSPGETFYVGLFRITAFQTPHDSEACLCYRVENGGVALGYATDIGKYTKDVDECLCGCENILIESNHDVRLLKEGSYPYSLKMRILGNYGHLSNDVCAKAVCHLVENGAKRITLAHLSEENNRPSVAMSAAKGALAAKGISVADGSDGSIILNVAPVCGITKIV